MLRYSHKKKPQEAKTLLKPENTLSEDDIMMKNLKAAKEQSALIQKIYEMLANDEAVLEKELEALGQDPEEVSKQITGGIDAFYQLYQKDVNAETILNKVSEEMSAMSPMKQYTYLANLMTALGCIVEKEYGEDVWEKNLKDHQSILAAMEMGIIDEDSQHISNGISEMKKIVAENIEAFAVLFADHADMEKLQEACMTEEPEKVKAIAMNTRKAVFDMAAAIYLLQESGKLTVLGDTRYSARDIGVMAASRLEIDAANKSGSLEQAKKVFQKASRVAVTLLVASPGIMIGATVFATVALLTNFATIAMLITGAVIGINLKVHFDVLYEKVSPILEKGVHLLDITLEKVKPVYTKIKNWVDNTVMPMALPAWMKCRTFATEQIFVPAAAFILKSRKAITEKAGAFSVKVKALWEKAKVSVDELIGSAKHIVEESSNTEETAEVTWGLSEILAAANEETVVAAEENTVIPKTQEEVLPAEAENECTVEEYVENVEF